MATPLAPLKCRIAYLNSPTPKTLLLVQKGLDFLRRSELCNFGLFLPKFGCHGNFLGSLEILDSVFEFADLKNPTIHAKIVSISCTQMKLFLFECLASLGTGNFIDFAKNSGNCFFKSNRKWALEFTETRLLSH